MKKALIFILFLFVSVTVYSQKVQKVSAVYTYYAPETMSVEEAKRTALERAKIQAIADEFGTTVTQSTSTIVSNKNGESDTQFLSVGGSDVKGEWIETIGEPTYEITFENHFLVVICTIKGKAREIISQNIVFDVRSLRNGTTLRFESTEFKNGDDLFLFFKSPVDGNLAVYLLDEQSQQVYSILPYKSEKKSATPVTAEREYIFFSVKDADKDNRKTVDEYSLNCTADKEFNTLIVLFSPVSIGKTKGFNSAIDDKPDNISYTDFKRWLSKSLSTDKQLQYKQISLSIEK